MRKLIWFSTIVLVVMMFVGCIYDPSRSSFETENTNQSGNGNNNGDGGNGGQTPTTIPTNPGNKITKLQSVIDSDDVKDGDIIDLSKYPDITDFNATINKAVTIEDNKSKDFAGNTLNIVSDGVTLSGIKSANVTTQSSMKISGSSLASLNIAEVSSSTPSANMIVGRGDSSDGSTMLTDRGTTQPPVVEVTDTEVEEDVSVGIANAYLTVEKRGGCFCRDC